MEKLLLLQQLLYIKKILDNISTPLENYSPDEMLSSTVGGHLNGISNGIIGPNNTNPMLNVLSPSAVAAAFGSYAMPPGFPSKYIFL